MKFKMTSRQLIHLIVKVAILGSIAFLLQLLEFPLPLMPGFLTLDLSDLPALIGAFSLGPIAGIIIKAISNLLFIASGKDVTATIGPIANIIAGAALVGVAGLVYRLKKNRQAAIIGMALGTLAMTAVMAIGNYYVFIPLYESVLKFPAAAVIGMVNGANPHIEVTNLRHVIVYAFVPFNIFKGLVVSAVTYMLYKRLSPILHKNY